MGHGAPLFSALNPRRLAMVVVVVQPLGAGAKVPWSALQTQKNQPHKLGVDPQQGEFNIASTPVLRQHFLVTNLVHFV
jgi:hypothetical protein